MDNNSSEKNSINEPKVSEENTEDITNSRDNSNDKTTGTIDELLNKEEVKDESSHHSNNKKVERNRENELEEEDFEISLWDKQEVQQKWYVIWRKQLYIMLKKNFTLQLRFWKSTLLITVITPICVMLLLQLLQLLMEFQAGKEIPHPESYPLSGLENCEGPIDNKDSCINLMFTNCIDGAVCERDEAVDTIMANFVEKNNQRMALNWEANPDRWENWDDTKLNTEVKERHDIVHVPNSNFIYNYSLMHHNFTHFGVVFDIKRETNGATNFRYQVWYNATLHQNDTDSFGSRVLSVARGLDEAIMTYTKNDPNIKATFNIDFKDFPTIPLENIGEAAMSSVGAVFFFCSAMVVFINTLNTVVSEKETKIRYSMEMMGLYKSVYWLSWFIIYFILILINTFATIIFGMIFQYSVFTNTNFFVLFFLFFCFGIAMIAMGFFITTLVSTSRTAVLFGIFMLIIGFLFQSFLFSNPYLAYIWWSTSVPSFIKYIFFIFPFFNFGRLYFDIMTLASSTVNNISGTISKGEGFFWSSLSTKPESYISYVLSLDDLSTSGQSIWLMIFDAALYIILTLYFDNIIPNEFGNCKPFYYIFLPSYWGFGKSSKQSEKEWIDDVVQKYPANYDVSKLDSDVYDQINFTCDSANNSPIKIVNLSKQYGRGKNKKVVISGSYLSFNKNKVVALLGQNGAGKSTTINILAGLTPPTNGDISVFGKRIRTDLNGVQRELGICPQHDILFDDLTAMEHLRLYTGLKGASSENFEKLLEERLKAVRLWTVKDARTNTYSGGMKRRLSMIIATIGDPKVVLLDEPTTGMDPLNRRHVWKFIEKFKKDRCVILTTHSMEEADAIGDDIIIMSNGDIKAIGNGIHLKNKFGAGYRISMIAKNKKTDQVKKVVSEYVPGATLEDDSAGALIYNFTVDQVKYVPEFIKYLDKDPDDIISNWGISQTTLEEVFLYVIQDSSNRKIKSE